MALHLVEKKDFDEKLTEAGDKLVVVDFYAPWCGPCKMIAPKIEELAAEFASSIVIIKIDVDESEELASEYGIQSMPTFVFIKNSQTLETFSGANYDKLRQTIEKNI